MAILTLKVKGQTLTVESEIDRIVENSINYLDFCIVCDDENWEDLAKKVIVTYDKKAWEAFTVIPSETIHSPGFTISVIGSRKPGTNGENDLGEVVTTYPVAVKVFPSGATDGSDPEDTAIDFSTADELNAKITEINSNLSSEMNKLDEKIETVNSNLSSIEEQLSTAIEGVDSSLSSTIEGLDKKIEEVDSNLSSTSQTINQSIEELEKDIEENCLHSNQLKDLIDENSTNLEIPTAKATYEALKIVREEIPDISEENLLKITDVITDSNINPAEKHQVYSAEVMSEVIAELVNKMSERELAEHKLTEYTEEPEDYNYYSAKVINDMSIKEITKPCHIADLDVGTYIIKSNLSDLSEGDELMRVTLANINEEEQLEDDFWEIYSGTLTISHKYEEETDEYIRVATSFVANGNMNTPDWTTLSEMQDDEGNIYMESEICSIKNASNVEMFMLISTKFKEDQGNGIEAGKWYSGLDHYWGHPSSDIPASALVETIDENSTRFKVPTAKAVYEFGQALQTDNDSSTIKTITTPCYIADLDVGTYLVNGNILDFDNELGQVIIQNVTPDGKINDRYFILFNGIISITQKYIVNEDDTEERIAISFTASGNMSTPEGINITETTDKDGNIIMKETIATTSFSSSVSYIIAEYVKPKVDNPDKGYVAGQWYNEDLFSSIGDVSCEALTEEITSESTRFQVPTAKAVYDCVEALKTEIMGDLDEISDLIGGETGDSEVITETIITEGTYAFDDYSIIGDGRRYYFHNFKNMPSATTVTENDMFILKFNGETYKLSWIFVEGEALLGNLVIMGAPEGSEYDTGENFCICYDDETTLSFYTTLPKGDYTVSLEKIVGGAE